MADYDLPRLIRHVPNVGKSPPHSPARIGSATLWHHYFLAHHDDQTSPFFDNLDPPFEMFVIDQACVERARCLIACDDTIGGTVDDAIVRVKTRESLPITRKKRYDCAVGRGNDRRNVRIGPVVFHRQTTPNASIASATFLNPAMFAPLT